MTHLRRVAIRGYRSISRANLRLGEITAVIGESDVGKSNLVRALRDWSYTSLGVGAISNGHSVMRIAVVVGPKHRIVYEKGAHGTGKKGEAKVNTTARYLIQDGETDEVITLEKFGRVTPIEVSDLTDIRPLKIDDETSVRINFATQAEPWFLLSGWTGAKVARVLARVSGMESLLLANQDLAKQDRRLGREIKEVEARREKLRDDLGAYGWAEGAKVYLDQARELVARQEQAQGKLAMSTRILQEVSRTKRDLKARGGFRRAAAEALSRTQSALERLELYGRVLATQSKIEALRGALERSSRSRETKRANLDKLATRFAKLARDPALTCPLCGGSAHRECRDRLIQEAG